MISVFLTSKDAKDIKSNSFKMSINSQIIQVFKRDYQLYLLALPVVIYVFIFDYIPFYGVQIAFKDFTGMESIWASPWVGLEQFYRFFHSFQFWNLLKNTLGISIYQLVASFPVPIVLALLINQTQNKLFKSCVQTVTYAPYFISIVVLVGMMNIFLSPRTGIVNLLISRLGGQPVFFMGEPSLFKTLYVLSGIWQNSGWASIIYLAALSSISNELYEAAKVDGASKLKQIIHVDLPGIVPTTVIMLILNAGQMMNVGFQKAFLMQNAITENSQEIISTYVYKVGIVNNQYSYSTAIGLFNSVINVILLIAVNKVVKKLSENSLW